MFPFYSYFPFAQSFPSYPTVAHTHPSYRGDHDFSWDQMYRQPTAKGQATWTEGGQVTKCGIPWSDNGYMTVAVGTDSPYQCGQTLKVRNLSSASPKEILVKVVDQVPGYPIHNLILHQRAFTAVGANLGEGVINIEISPSTDVEGEEWGRYLLTVAESAYPNYQAVDYQFVDRTQISPTQTKRTYRFRLKSPHEELRVQAKVIYNPSTRRVISFDLNEI